MKSVKSKPVVSNEVMELESEEMLPEVPLEKVINETLVKANVTDAVIASLKEKYGGMQLKSIDDKETYLEICNARKVVRKVGILAEDCCKRGRERAVKEQKLWLSKQAEILCKIGEVQDPLDSEIEKFENEVERKELAEAKKKEETYINRQSTLLKLGAQYDNGSFVSGHISYEAELLKSADEEMWNDTILPKYRKVFEEVESARVAEENKRKEELAQQKADREKFEAEQKKFREEQESFAKQQRELQQQKDAHERQQREELERKHKEEKQKQQLLISDRMNRLKALGMDYSFTYNAMIFEDVNVDVQTELGIFNEDEWNELVQRIAPVIEERKKVIEEKRFAQQEKEKQAAIELAAQQEREKIAEQQRREELKKQQEAQRKQQEMEAAKDKEKYAAVIEYLQNFPKFAMTSNLYKGKMNIINDFVNDL